jgi:uncharacterized protein YjbI with pentapeptide repeats
MELTQNNEELGLRWIKEPRYVNLLHAVLNNLDSKTWYEAAPKIPHGWEPFQVCDLRKINLSSQTVGKVFLGDNRLDFSNFDNASFNETYLQGAVLTNASFKNARFNLAHMAPVYGENADFTDAVFDYPSSSEGKLLKSNFTRVAMEKGHFDTTDMTGGCFVSMRATNTGFYDNNFQDSDFSKAHLTGCNLYRASLRRCVLDHALFEGCDLRGVDFRGASLEGTVVSGGTFGVVQQGLETTYTKFDDTPQARALVEHSGAEGLLAIEWHAVDPDAPRAMSTHEKPVGVHVQPKARALPGEAVPMAGVWYTPAISGAEGTLALTLGQTLPATNFTDYGAVIWYWQSA